MTVHLSQALAQAREIEALRADVQALAEALDNVLERAFAESGFRDLNAEAALARLDADRNSKC